MARQFGVVSIVSGGTTALTGIIANNVTSGATVETATARDENGKVINNQAYSKTKTITVRGLLDASSPSVEAGNVIAISGGTYLITSSEKTESNTAFTEYSITAVSIDGSTPTAYS